LAIGNLVFESAKIRLFFQIGGLFIFYGGRIAFFIVGEFRELCELFTRQPLCQLEAGAQ
jgi:hypothetical protein